MRRPAVSRLKAVPQHRGTPTTGNVAADSPRDGWNLKWRKSSEVTPRRENPAQPSRPQRTGNGSKRVASVTWLTESPDSDALAVPAHLQTAVGEAEGREADGGHQDRFSGGRFNETTEEDSLGELEGPSQLAAPERTPTLPAPQPRSSLSKMLRENSPEPAADGASGLAPPSEPRRVQPSSQRSAQTPESQSRPESPSDLQPFDTNPFERARGGDDQSQRTDIPPRDQQQPGLMDEAGESVVGETGISCDEFRDRIAAQTIRQVSLDISPPFRPDVIDRDRYQKYKSEFDAAQQIRPWRSIDGRKLSEGRLTDLAYEKAVIETEQGTIERLPLNRLSEADRLYISNNWGLPTECLIEQVEPQPRQWAPVTMTWTASNLCHHPLYFEQVNLERYGHTAGPVLQPVVSSAHFFANIAVLPYKMGVHSPQECQYALGYYRPGNCAPWIVPPVPLSLRGGLSQAAAMTGAFWLVP